MHAHAHVVARSWVEVVSVGVMGRVRVRVGFIYGEENMRVEAK